jgi:hypothetical protein
MAHIRNLTNYPLYGFNRVDVYSGDSASLDGFSQIVLSGTSGIPVEELIHTGDSSRLIDAVQHVYRRYMAQAINSNMRKNLDENRLKSRQSDPTSTPNTLPATIIDPTRTRLVQNKTSTIILEVLLGLILLLSIGAYSTIDMKHLLPWNPCSVAGMAGLLVGSRMWGLLRDTDDSVEREKMMKKCRFSMGWWNDGKVLQLGMRTRGDDDRTGPIGQRFGIDIDDLDDIDEADQRPGYDHR